MGDKDLLCKFLCVSSERFTENGQLAVGGGEYLVNF